MFRKIVTELAYSPALAGNLGYYIKQLRNEVSRRQIGLIFVVLAVIIQLFSTLFPPASANANDPTAFIDGGISSIDEYLTYYDQNTGNIQDLLSSLGIERSEIKAAKIDNGSSLENGFMWSFQNTRENENNVYFFTTISKKPEIAYYQPFSSHVKTSPTIYVGSSAKGGKFAITESAAVIITENKPASRCALWIQDQTAPLQVDSWFSSYEQDCQSKIHTSLSGRRISSSSSELGTFSASERIAFTLSISNTSGTVIPVNPSINLEDILEYSRILDYGSGEYDFDTKNLTWPTTSLAPDTAMERTFIVQLLPTLPATARGSHVARSYDCEVTLSFGNILSTPVECPPTKYVERLTSTLPKIPTAINIIVAAFTILIVAFLFFRAKQLLTELYIIRHNHSGGL